MNENRTLFLIVGLAAATWLFLTLRNIARAIASGTVIVSFSWTKIPRVQPMTIYRNEDGLGFWLLILGKGLFAILLLGIVLIALLGALLSN